MRNRYCVVALILRDCVVSLMLILDTFQFVFSLCSSFEVFFQQVTILETVTKINAILWRLQHKMTETFSMYFILLRSTYLLQSQFLWTWSVSLTHYACGWKLNLVIREGMYQLWTGPRYILSLQLNAWLSFLLNYWLNSRAINCLIARSIYPSHTN